MKSKLALLTSALGLLAVGPVWAGAINFNFSDCSSISSPSPLPSGGACKGNLKTESATFNDSTNTYRVTAYGGEISRGNLVGLNLYVKQGGTTETGLGLAGTDDNEINAYQAIGLDMSDLLAKGIDSGTVWLGSLQSGESAGVCDLSTTLGLTNCDYHVKETGSSQIGSLNVTWGASDPFLVFFGPGSSSWCDNSGNFLLDSLTANVNSVPEPGSLALFALGLAGLAWAIASRKRALSK